MGKELSAVVESSVTEVSCKQMQREFVVNFHMNPNDERNCCIVSLKAITHPLFVFEDNGGNKGSYYCSLPERKWGRYFGMQIKRS